LNKIEQWRATVDEDGHYSFAVPYDAAARRTLYRPYRAKVPAGRHKYCLRFVPRDGMTSMSARSR
jgi:hypothetical protein